MEMAAKVVMVVSPEGELMGWRREVPRSLKAAWREAVSEALRAGAEVWECASRKRVIPWDGRMSALKLR
jgi:hypothetical protein